MENIMDIIIKIVATLLALGAGYLGKFLVGWIKSKLSAENGAKLDLFIDELCKAAEQMYKEDAVGLLCQVDYCRFCKKHTLHRESK